MGRWPLRQFQWRSSQRAHRESLREMLLCLLLFLPPFSGQYLAMTGVYPDRQRWLVTVTLYVQACCAVPPCYEPVILVRAGITWLLQQRGRSGAEQDERRCQSRSRPRGGNTPPVLDTILILEALLVLITNPQSFRLEKN